MTASVGNNPAADLIRVRLLATGSKPPSRAEISKSLAPFFEHRCSPAEWKSVFEEALDWLVQQGDVAAKPLALTESGRARALAFLGSSELPARIRWPALRDTWLVAKALNAPVESVKDRQRLKEADGLRAFVLKKTYELPLEGCPTLKQAVDALAWNQLGIATDRPLTLAALIEELLGRLVESPVRLKKEQLQRQIPAKLLGAAKPDAADLRLAAIRRLLNADERREAVENNGATPFPARTEQFDLSAFSHQVREAARQSRTGHFGENKVFISHVWNWLQNQRTFQSMDESQFKERLVEANRAGFLSLSRADLVEAMDPADLANSETRHLNAAFHFVQVPETGAVLHTQGVQGHVARR